MKVIKSIVSQNEAKKNFLEINNNRRLVTQLKGIDFFYRPFWLVKADYAGKARLAPVEGTVVALADARIFRLGIVGIWKRMIEDYSDLQEHGVNFSVEEAQLSEAGLEGPLIDRDRVMREVEGFALRKIMSKALALTGVSFTDVVIELVYRPYWNIRYTMRGREESAFMCADGVLLRKKI